MSSRKKTRKRKTSKTPGIYDVAKEARVSVFTVSAVVNGKSHVGKALRQRVEGAIQKLNYRPNLLARSLANRRTHTIGTSRTTPASPLVDGRSTAPGREIPTVRACESLKLSSWDAQPKSRSKRPSAQVFCRPHQPVPRSAPVEDDSSWMVSLTTIVKSNLVRL